MKKNPRLLGLRGIRKGRGMTLDECARHLFVHMRTVSAWEQGRCAPPIHEAHDIALRLGVPIDQLLGTLDLGGGESYNGMV